MLLFTSRHWTLWLSSMQCLSDVCRMRKSRTISPVWGKMDNVQFFKNTFTKCQVCSFVTKFSSFLALNKSWLNQFLVWGDLDFRDCHVKCQCYAQISGLNPQTHCLLEPTSEVDQFSISNGPPPSRVHRPIRLRGLQIALHPALQLQQKQRSRWHQVQYRNDWHQRTQRDTGHDGNCTKYTRHVLESRHDNVLRFLQETRLTKPGLLWKWN